MFPGEDGRLRGSDLRGMIDEGIPSLQKSKAWNCVKAIIPLFRSLSLCLPNQVRLYLSCVIKHVVAAWVAIYIYS